MKNLVLKKPVDLKFAKSIYEAKLKNAKTERNFNVLKISTAHKLTPKQIKRIRLNAKVSQSVFSKYINMSNSTVEKWETGQKRPTGAALKLLHLVAKKGISILS
jgi:putative transcriptional regulator